MKKGPVALSRRNAGFSLMEVVIAMAIVAFALFGLISTIAYTTRMNMANQERMIAMRAAEMQIETMLNTPFTSLIQNWFQYSSQKTWSGYQGGINVAGLSPQLTYGYRANGQANIMFVDFPSTPPSGSYDASKIYETATLAMCGASLDLDMNGVFNETTDKSASALIIPANITLYWKGIYGNTQMTYQYIFHHP
jgi:prepilin-type N-terminal cleavage/methylation domain-containing protein